MVRRAPTRVGHRVVMEPRTRAELDAGLDHLLASPLDDGVVELLVARPGVGERTVLDEAKLDPAIGLVGDSWTDRFSRHTPDGSPNPVMQLTLMNARAAALVARTVDRIPLAGDQLYVDLELGYGNLPAGTQLAVGTAVAVSVETLVAVAVAAAVSVAVGTTAVFVAVVVGCAVSVEVGTAVAVGVGPTKTSALTGPMVRLEEVAVTELAYVPGVDGTAA